MKINKEQLNKINDIVKFTYRDLALPELGADQLRAAAWIIAVYGVLMPEITPEFPKRNMMDEGQD